MPIIEFSMFNVPPESESRKLDQKVAREEMPYGYTSPPPPADTGDYDSGRLDSDKQYRPKRY